MDCINCEEPALEDEYGGKPLLTPQGILCPECKDVGGAICFYCKEPWEGGSDWTATYKGLVCPDCLYENTAYPGAK